MARASVVLGPRARSLLRVAGLGLALLLPRAAAAELIPKSRNSVVFVESVREGEEWEAFRVVDAQHPAHFTITQPGRAIIRLRTLGRPEPVDAVAAVLLDEQVVLTARVPAAVDESAQLSDGGGRPSGVRVFLLKVDQAPARLVVRYSEGPPLLVSARYGPPLAEAEVEGAEVPLVAPKPVGEPSIPTVGSLRREGGTLAAGPAEPAPEPPAAEELSPAPAEPPPAAEPLPEGDASGPDDEPAPPAFWEAPNEDIELDTGVQLRRTALLLEGRAGMHVDGLAPSPGGTIGVGLRVPVLDAEQARLLSVGLGLDGAYLNGEARVTQAGAVVGVSRFTHAFVALTADARLRLLAVGDTAELYAGLGGGVLLGRATLSGYRGDVDAGTRGFLGAASAGVTMGTAGHRPFLEVRGWAGALSSPLVRSGAGEAPGGGSGFFALAAVVGYRFEFLGRASAAR